MQGTPDDAPTDEKRQDLFRLLRVLGCCLFFAGIFALNYQPTARVLSIFALASVFSIAALYELSAREVGPGRMVLAVCLIFTIAGAACLALGRYAPRIEAHGALLAGHAPTPSSRCTAPPGDTLTMVFGTDQVTGQGNGPFTPVRIGTCPALTLERKGGGLFINAFGFDSDDNLVFRVENNSFRQVIRGFLSDQRPDASTLRIADNEGKETLNVRYLNSGTVKIRGVFRCGDSRPVVIGDDLVAIGGLPQQGHRCARMTPRGAPVIDYANP